MSEKQHSPEVSRILDQLPDRYDPVGADLSSFGMGSYEDFQRHLVLPLQSHFQEEMRGNDGSGHILGTPIQPWLHRTLHGQLLDYVLELADAIGCGISQSVRIASTVRAYYRKYAAWLSVRRRNEDR